MREPLWVVDLGRIRYGEALDLQRRLVATKIAQRETPDVLFVLEHPPVITLGRNAREENIVTPRETLEAMGFDIFHVERGGDVTYHGPGQLVGYPILDLHRVPKPKDVGWFVWAMQEAVIRALARYGITGERIEKVIGVWVRGRELPPLDDSFDEATRAALAAAVTQFSDRKIAAIGARIKEWVSYHGFALNVNTNLRHFDLIVPCGLRDRGVTSMQAELGREIPMGEIKPVVARTFAEVMEREIEWHTLDDVVPFLASEPIHG